MSSGGSICGIRQVGQANSVSPGATVKIIRQPAQRTRTPSEGCDGGAVGGGGGGCRGGGGDGTGGCVILILFLSSEKARKRREFFFFYALISVTFFFVSFFFLPFLCFLFVLGIEPNGNVYGVNGWRV
jgi:hypothetical protein